MEERRSRQGKAGGRCHAAQVPYPSPCLFPLYCPDNFVCRGIPYDARVAVRTNATALSAAGGGQEQGLDIPVSLPFSPAHPPHHAPTYLFRGNEGEVVTVWLSYRQGPLA